MAVELRKPSQSDAIQETVKHLLPNTYRLTPGKLYDDMGNIKDLKHDL